MANEKKSKRGTKAATRSRKKKPETTTAIHAQSEDGSKHVVGIGNLRVVLYNDDGSWFAQSLEIDYAAQGSSLEDVQQRFQEGLRQTIDFHLKMYGNIRGVLQVAPPEVWAELFSSGTQDLFTHSQVSFHTDDYRLPFQGIEFYEKAAAA